MPEEPTALAVGSVALGDLEVRRLGFGAMRLTGPGVWGPPADRGECVAVLRRAVERGVTFIDTADSYGPSVSEEIIAEALVPYPPDVVIATKGGLLRDGPGQWRPDGRPTHLRAACESSLRRLGLEQIPLYQFHRPDPAVPFDESVGALAELKSEGKIAHIGLSNVEVDQLERARTLVPVVSVQNRYNVADRSSEDVLDACTSLGLAFIPWSPLSVGDRHQGLLEDAAGRHGVTPTAIALAWLLARSPVTLPIPGTSSLAHLDQNLAAAEVHLGPDEVRMLTGAGRRG